MSTNFYEFLEGWDVSLAKTFDFDTDHDPDPHPGIFNGIFTIADS